MDVDWPARGAKRVSDQLQLTELGAAALTRSRDEAFAVARARVLDPHSPNTQRSYRTAFGRWCAYADAHDMPWAPIDVVELVTYLEQLSQVLAPNSVRLHLSALCSLDRAARVTVAAPNPQSLREHIVVTRWEQSWGRSHPKAPQRKAAAFSVSELERLLLAAAEPQRRGSAAAHVVRYARDRCLILLGVCGALRGDDLTQLELGDVHVTERGLSVFIRFGKTDQAGAGMTVGLLPQGKVGLCPVDAFVVWRRVRGDAPGPLFPAVGRGAELELRRPLTERQVTRLVSSYAARAGIEACVSAHSMRATFATLAASQGKSLARIMAHGRWRSAEVAAGYMRQGQLFDDNASAGLLT